MTTRIGRPRDPVKEQFWRRTIADQARCGLSIKAYCQREGLEPRNFHRWRQVLARRDREVPSAQTVHSPDSFTQPVRSSAFLPVRVVQNASRANGVDHTHRDRAAFRTHCPGHARLRSTSPRLGALGTGGTSMLSLPPSVRILLAREPADMRKGFDGLAHLVQSVLQEDPLSGHLFVFRNRRGDRIKLLLWDTDGFLILYKRLEKGTFRFPASTDADATSVTVNATDLIMLLDGVDLQSVKRRPRYVRNSA